MFAIRIAFESIDEINYLKMHFVLIALFDIKVKSLNVIIFKQKVENDSINYH